MNETQYDIVVYGATGFTGQLICEYISQRPPGAGPIRWAMAGRSPEKLAQLGRRLNAGHIPAIVADATDPGSLGKLVASTRTVISAVGPYQAYGTALVMPARARAPITSIFAVNHCGCER